uniref:Uncharacterized protein n=1 Tax=Oryza sativa subsp. japonica TaxID=39947 RepID=Q10NY8_ORYSJ|nr:hypothetical protein LOC_Os03g14920 [Oryza sativa Japonica Group]
MDESTAAGGRPLELRIRRPDLPLASFLLPIDCAMAVAAALPTVAGELAMDETKHSQISPGLAAWAQGRSLLHAWLRRRREGVINGAARVGGAVATAAGDASLRRMMNAVLVTPTPIVAASTELRLAMPAALKMLGPYNTTASMPVRCWKKWIPRAAMTMRCTGGVGCRNAEGADADAGDAAAGEECSEVGGEAHEDGAREEIQAARWRREEREEEEGIRDNDMWDLQVSGSHNFFFGE